MTLTPRLSLRTQAAALPRVALHTFAVLATALFSGCFLTGDDAPPTINDRSSPYYDRSCILTQFVEHRSDLQADCRCFTNQAPASGIDLCKRPYNLSLDGISVGDGPTIAGLHQAEYFGGFLDEDEGTEGTVYVSGGYGPSLDRSGVIMRVDVATGDRTVVLERGPFDGPSWNGLPEFWRNVGYVFDVQPGPGNLLYAFAEDSYNQNIQILAVDRDTGDVTLMWTTNGLGSEPVDYGFCETLESPYRLQITKTGFAVDDEGRVYLPFANPTQGRGIVRLSADFRACEVVTGNGVAEATRGTGPYIGGFIQGFTFHDGLLYAFSTGPKQFFSVDLGTGDRTLLAEPDGVTPTERWAVWDEPRQVWWLAGMSNGVSIDAFDPVTGESTDIFNGGVFPWMPLGAAGPIQINSLNYAPIWLRENGNLLVAQDGFSIVEYEPSSGNSIVRSL